MALVQMGCYAVKEAKTKMKNLDDQVEGQVEPNHYSRRVKIWCGVGFVVVGFLLFLTVMLMAKAGYSLAAVMGAAIPFILIKLILVVVGSIA